MSSVPLRAPKAGFEHHVCFSYASEDRREHVDRVAAVLKEKGVLYYDYANANTLGKNLPTDLPDLYENRAEYCVVFFSQHHAKKPWTQFELRSAKVRMFRENRPYILLYRLDDTRLPWFMRNIVYADKKDTTAAEFAEKVVGTLDTSEDASYADRIAERDKQRRRRKIRNAIAVAVVLTLLSWYAISHYNSHTSVAVGSQKSDDYIVLQVKNSGWKPSDLVGYRLKFKGLPIEDTPLTLFDNDGSGGRMPANDSVEVHLIPIDGELGVQCENGKAPKVEDIMKILGGPQVTLEIDVRESDGETHTRKPEAFDAKELRGFIDRWFVPPPC